MALALSKSRQTPPGATGSVGYHYDLHATALDTDLGARSRPAALARALARARPDFVQTDCKGHPGYASWPSRTPGAAVPPGLAHDPLADWRVATRRLGLPLHCHYSGIWDEAAIARHPEWAVVPAPSRRGAAAAGQNTGGAGRQKICPRSGYLAGLMIPQLLELVERYAVDGFWVDGDLWAVEPCYCPRCRAAWRAETGFTRAPTAPGQPRWARWMQFHRESFFAFVRTYVAAVKARAPHVRICSNWLQTFCDPGEPAVPTDWISGDLTSTFGNDYGRVEARFISTRGKPWDVMLWGFYFMRWNDPSALNCFKSLDMICQEAASVVALGGGLQFYDSASTLRDGRLVGWHLDRLGRAAAFVRRRRALCAGAGTWPQVAVLHSEAHLRATYHGWNQMWDIDAGPVRGATYALLENHLAVDVLDEWALTPRLDEFPLVVVPERTHLSAEMVAALRGYVERGGRLLLTGADCSRRWDDAWLGIEQTGEAAERGYYVPLAGGAEAAPLWSRSWRLVRPRPRATAVLTLEPAEEPGTGPGRPAPLGVLRAAGRGQVLTVPCDLFRELERNQHAPLRRVVGALVARFGDDWRAARLEAPAYVDLILRRKGRLRIAHLINRNTGLPDHPARAAVEEIAPLGPLTLRLRCAARPRRVRLAFERAAFTWSWSRGWVTCLIGRLRLHAAVVVEAT